MPDDPPTLDVEVDGTGPLEVNLLDESYGLPPGSVAAGIAKERPASAVPSQDGDVTFVASKGSL